MLVTPPGTEKEADPPEYWKLSVATSAIGSSIEEAHAITAKPKLSCTPDAWLTTGYFE
jgi:hypothetical protein